MAITSGSNLDIEPTQTSGTIASIADQSGGTAYNLTPGPREVLARRSVRNGLPVAVLTFDEQNQSTPAFLLNTTYPCNLDTGITCAVVFDQPSNRSHESIPANAAYAGQRVIAQLGASLQAFLMFNEEVNIQGETGHFQIYGGAVERKYASRPLCESNVAVVAMDSTSWAIWFNGVVTKGTWNESGDATAGIYLGTNSGGQRVASLSYYRILGWGRKLSEVEMIATGKALAEKYQVPLENSTEKIHVSGDSITASFWSETGLGWVARMGLEPNYQVQNWATAGNSYNAQETMAANYGMDFEMSATHKNHLLIAFGSNDLAADTAAATIYQQQLDFISDRRAAGMDGRALIATPMLRTDFTAAMITQHTALVNLIVAGAEENDHGVIPFHSIPEADPTSAVYFYDGIHPRDLLFQIMAAVAKQALADAGVSASEVVNLQPVIDAVNGIDTTGLATGEQLNLLTGTLGNLDVERRVYLQFVASELKIVRGDHYNGIDSPKLTWNSEKTYGVAKPVNLIVFEGDNVVAEGVGSVEGKTIVIDNFEAEFDESLFRGNPLAANLRYAVVAGTKETLRYGRCQVEYRADID